MSSGYSACSAEVITWDSICQILPEESTAFRRHVEDLLAWSDFLEAMSETKKFEGGCLGENLTVELTEAAVDKLEELFDKFCECFASETIVGNSCLMLGLSNHDSEGSGSRYDEVDGPYWYVEGAYQLTPAGEKFQKHLDRRHYVTFG